MELVKMRLQLQGIPGTSAKMKLYKSSWDCAKQVYRDSGIRGLYRGLGMTMFRDCPALGVYFASYEWLTRQWATGGPETLTTFHLLFAGGEEYCSRIIVRGPPTR